MIKLNMELVNESIAELSKIQFLSGRVNNDRGYMVINDFHLARHFAFIKNDYYYNQKEGYTWTDIRELEMAEVNAIKYADKDYRQISKELDALEIPEDKMDVNTKYDDIFEEIYTDLNLCLRTRALSGSSNVFFEQILAAYKSGGWPCGWDNYPEGKLVVFYER